MIVLNQISKYFDKNFPIHQMSYIFENNKTYILSGPSGSGKTTLLRLLMGLETLDEGKIFYNDRLLSSVDFLCHPSKRNIGMVLQNPGLWNHMSVMKNIGFGLDGNDARQGILHVAKQLHIHHLLSKYPQTLSGGEKKRVALARMLVHRWEYLLLDEPLVHVEEDLKLSIISFLNTYAKENQATLIYASHDMAEIEALKGKIIYSTDKGFSGDLNGDGLWKG